MTEAPRFKPEGRGFESRCGNCTLVITEERDHGKGVGEEHVREVCEHLAGGGSRTDQELNELYLVADVKWRKLELLGHPIRMSGTEVAKRFFLSK
jgi:hypothetical protein